MLAPLLPEAVPPLPPFPEPLLPEALPLWPAFPEPLLPEAPLP
ncbi:hypothetical protein BN2475_1290026 [Paraburkholderia ribeironis]|uniref:Uncharacterized protein n=1 Tax=Paraburkholderia ribeironis TaxID=1247936 RepID=A0A1N7SPG8_9BURK|nr:hypothetical protein BN2475_1290026 [Paraburkholderia ribeironis]